MPRTPRIFVPNTSVHVIQRGNNRTDIFVTPAHFQVFLAFLRKSAIRRRVVVHAYVLMTTHYHLIVTPTESSALSQMMKELGERYVKYFNRDTKRVGTLWNGRYRSLLIDDECYWLACLRYVEQNPVRAGMVATADEYRWSSYRAHAHGQWDDWLTPHPVYQALGVTAAERQCAYRSICGENVSVADREMVSPCIHS